MMIDAAGGVIFSRMAHIIYQNDGERICSRAGRRIADRTGNSGWTSLEPGFEDAAVEKGQAVPHLRLQGAFMNSHEKRGTFG